jgi:hypothetical protein
VNDAPETTRRFVSAAWSFVRHRGWPVVVGYVVCEFVEGIAELWATPHIDPKNAGMPVLETPGALRPL